MTSEEAAARALEISKAAPSEMTTEGFCAMMLARLVAHAERQTEVLQRMASTLERIADHSRNPFGR